MYVCTYTYMYVYIYIHIKIDAHSTELSVKKIQIIP